MTTVQKVKDAKKAALQDELKFYSGLLAAHYSSMKTNSQHLNVQSTTTRNPANSCNTFKTTANHPHLYKSTSFQRNVTKLPNQNLKDLSSFTLHKKIDFLNNGKISNSFNLSKYPCKSSMVKINSSALSYKSSNTEKTLEQKNLAHSKKQMKSDILNKPAESSSQTLMDEIQVLLKQLKQKTGNVDNKANHVSSKVLSLNKCILNKPELKATIKVSSDSKIICNTLSNSQTINLKDKNCNTFSSVDSSLLSSKNCNSSVFNEKKKNSQVKLSDNVNTSLVKPVTEFKNSFQQQSRREIPIKTSDKAIQDLRASFGNVNASRVINIVKTPIKKKLIAKHINSVKKLNGTTLFATKYKVINKKLPCVQQEKIALVTTEVKTPLKIKPVQKHINSVKKTKGGARLITTKYKIINKKLPCVQSLSSEANGSDDVCKLSVNNWIGLKTNGIKLKASKLNSKYKIVNKSEKPVPGPASFLENKSINVKEGKLAEFVHHRNKKNLNKFNTSSSSRKYVYTALKLNGERKVIKSTTPLKLDASRVLNLKRKRHNPFISNSKYRTVNKQPISSLKKISETVKSNNSSSGQNSSIDLDLLMELAAEKNKCNDDVITNSLNKHILIKRVYKSKNAIVNKNICSLESKAAKMIKTKYSILNKKHSWQKQGFTKRLISPKCFKGHKFDNIYQRKMPFYHNQRKKRNNTRLKIPPHVSTYFAGRSYSRNYLVSKNRSNAVGSSQSMVKTPKRFVLNRKVYLKSPNIMKSVVTTPKSMASRALNRSINRVLTASVKKKTSKMNIYCMFYNRFGRCNKGIKCPYVHDPSKIAVCTRFLRGTCKAENCPFSHEICPGKMAICSFFLLGSCTKTDCPYRHETLSPNAKLCKAFVQGYCPDGKQCKQAHVLVCPQFVQGHCDKGDACPFPHPPSKEKKTIPNLAEKSENLEETEELILEKMSRYFECAYESPTNGRLGVNSIAVPRIRTLPEQPSFIAL